MRSLITTLIFAIAGGLLLGTGTIYRFYGWADDNIGGWFVPVMLGALGLVVVLPPIIKGILAGVREANQDQAT
jgi:hypothetical protein